MAKAHWALESFFKALPNRLSQRGGQTDRHRGEIFKLCNVQPIQKTN